MAEKNVEVIDKESKQYIDVYKRQVLYLPLPAGFQVLLKSLWQPPHSSLRYFPHPKVRFPQTSARPRQSWRSVLAYLLPLQQPVSYTQLDVYKRQGDDTARRRCRFPYHEDEASFDSDYCLLCDGCHHHNRGTGSAGSRQSGSFYSKRNLNLDGRSRRRCLSGHRCFAYHFQAEPPPCLLYTSRCV